MCKRAKQMSDRQCMLLVEELKEWRNEDKIRIEKYEVLRYL